MLTVKEAIYNVCTIILDKADLSKLGHDRKHQLYTLASLQNRFNDLLRLNERVYLNDVYKSLKLRVDEKSPINHVGWQYRPNDTTIDSFVDFGIWNLDNKDFINGYGNRIILDFNVDGVID